MKPPTKPNAESIVAPLKPFQRRTVDHAFHRLFEAGDSSSRFLVADEVGLGKTLVARGIIARAIEHLWDTTERIDIIYICSNASIARSNLPKLRVGGSESRSLPATRLTMLATQLAAADTQLQDSKLNFVSFTPSTSFKLGHSGGQSHERIVLYYLLKEHIRSQRHTGLKNLLQGAIRSKERWRARIEQDVDLPLDDSIKGDFADAFNGAKWKDLVDETIDRWFRRYNRSGLPEEARQQRSYVIGSLRKLLAECCVKALEPDLVIMDEFQRFKTLLETREGDAAAELAQELFSARTPEGHPVRTLLLSATPYKLYTTDAERGGEDDHYADFIATTRFLLDDEDRLSDLGRSIAEFRGALKEATYGLKYDATTAKVKGAKESVEKMLRNVMARTERVVATDDRDAMVKEHRAALTPRVAEVQQYLAADDLFRAVGAKDPLRYWKSAPYLAHFMRGYNFDRNELPDGIENSPEKTADAIRRHAHAYLRSAELNRFGAVDPGNAKLSDEVSTLLDTGLWKLLWMPPTTPYWPLEGPFAKQEGATKTLLFSAWNVVPDVVSGVLSYEAERRMVQGGRVSAYKDPASQQGQRLTLDAKGAAGRARTRHRLLLLLMPCLPLADIHPLSAPAGSDRREWVAERINDLLLDRLQERPDLGSGQEDHRWEWVAPLLLDDGLRGFLEEWRDDPDLPPSTDHFPSYLNDLLDLDVSELGRVPDSLSRLLTDVALGSPAIVAARMLQSDGVKECNRRRAAVRIADAFWHLFNRPAVIGLLDQLYGAMHERHTSGVEGGYWRAVLRYSHDGNLQAVLDEQWHLLWEQSKWGDPSDDDAMMDCCSRMVDAILPNPSRVHVRLFDDFLEDEEEPALRDDLRVRTIFALRFGQTEIEAEDGRPVSQDVVRGAFNSPFRPFVLASTSVGQEGLDFHPWCRRIVHWDLPGNPVDLEQREGRVHRYKCHAVRANVAAKWAGRAMERWRLGDDLWQLAFELADEAAREAGEHDLVPFWLAPGEHYVERHVPLLSYSREVEAFQRLKRQLAAYRVVFGQPRQEELVTLLADFDLARLRDWAIDLSPPWAG